jgi:hypothetical protein
MSRQYTIVADDGSGNEVRVEISREKLCQLISDTFWLGACASQEIEGEKVEDEDYICPVVTNLPENLLVTT